MKEIMFKAWIKTWYEIYGEEKTNKVLREFSVTDNNGKSVLKDIDDTTVYKILEKMSKEFNIAVKDLLYKTGTENVSTFYKLYAPFLRKKEFYLLCLL
ncbi:MAG TPA: heme NO-binding domain-containing protein [Tepiditoga sp.]|nr:heme NO-binding domain-containing protein [Thermotogota bacterium]HOO75463.1 heme NO-binding domain-containing protein [Tepiditoga sp.]